MDMNKTPAGERIHIGFFGARNAGKSSVANAVLGQEMSVVSDKKGTTTDPVYKSMELLPLGAVVIIDTPGFDDDEGVLGELRVKKTRGIINKCDIAVLVIDAEKGLGQCDKQLVSIFRERGIDYVIAFNKVDLANVRDKADKNTVYVSARTGEGINELKERLGSFSARENEIRIVGDLIKSEDFVVLVTPIDAAAPKGRLILPQQQTIRDILDAGAVAVVTKETELAQTLRGLLKKPALVITDSQAFGQAAHITPKDIKLTSFSILMARHKGFLDTAVEGAAEIDKLRNGDTVLISEGCTHHRQCGDIGTVKIPALLKRHTGRELNIKTSSGTEYPEDLSDVALVIHCGGCMLNPREVEYRMKLTAGQGVPITNYGTALAFMNGILKRSVEIFPHLYNKL